VCVWRTAPLGLEIPHTQIHTLSVEIL